MSVWVISFQADDTQIRDRSSCGQGPLFIYSGKAINPRVCVRRRVVCAIALGSAWGDKCATCFLSFKGGRARKRRGQNTFVFNFHSPDTRSAERSAILGIFSAPPKSIEFLRGDRAGQVLLLVPALSAVVIRNQYSSYRDAAEREMLLLYQTAHQPAAIQSRGGGDPFGKANTRL